MKNTIKGFIYGVIVTSGFFALVQMLSSGPDFAELNLDQSVIAPEQEQAQEQENLTLENNQIYTGESFIELDSPLSNSIFEREPIAFRGRVSPNVNKIVVRAIGNDGMNDVYTLQNFRPGDQSFVYQASRPWANLSIGFNDYIFEAHYSDGTFRTARVVIYFQP